MIPPHALRHAALALALIGVCPALGQMRMHDVEGLNVLAVPRAVAPGMELIATVTTGANLPAINATMNYDAADTTNAQNLRNPPYNLTGTGLTIGVWEAAGRIRSTHQELAGRVTAGDTGGVFDNHATHVAGTIAAAGFIGIAQGMASNVTLRGYSSANDLTEMSVDAFRMPLSNHSYGLLRGWANLDWGLGAERTWVADRSLYQTEDPSMGKYDANARDLDTVLYDNPRLLSVWSAGNDRDDTGVGAPTPGGAGTYVTFLSAGASGAGFYRVNTSAFPLPAPDGNGGTGYDSLPQSQVAKNSLTVGAINAITAEGPTRSALMSVFSSYGPTDDGRMKPDVVGSGVGVLSTFANNDGAYGVMSGTSMSAPNVTGTLALVVEHLMDVRNTTQLPLSATTKALAIHTAHDLFATGPDYSSGYGVVDGLAAVEFIDAAASPAAADHLVESTFAGSRYSLTMRATGGPLKATLVWTDPEGSAVGGGIDVGVLKLVNDLDLLLTDAAMNQYFPWTLNPANPSAAALRNARNFRDNVEQVLIGNTLAGSIFTISINLSGLLTNGGQPFSLLVSGASFAIPEPGALAALVVAIPLLIGRRKRRNLP